MRAAEFINLAFFLFLIALAWGRALILNRRAKVTAVGLGIIGLVSSAQFLDRFFNPLTSSVIRDWLPAALFLVAYWTAGLFFTIPSEKLQNGLMQFDRKVLGWLRELRADTSFSPSIAACLELAYLLCYPLLPCGVGVLYIARMGRHADEFWTIVLISAYLCYAALPFAQVLPPRMLKTGEEPILPHTRIRRLNLWVLRRGSIQVNTLPSAHVATAFSVSLVLLQLVPWAGMVFLCISVGIAIGSVLGRYHYAADALMGAALAIAVFLSAAVWL